MESICNHKDIINGQVSIATPTVTNKEESMRMIKEEIKNNPDKLANYLYVDNNGETKTGTMTLKGR